MRGKCAELRNNCAIIAPNCAAHGLRAVLEDREALAQRGDAALRADHGGERGEEIGKLPHRHARAVERAHRRHRPHVRVALQAAQRRARPLVLRVQQREQGLLHVRARRHHRAHPERLLRRRASSAAPPYPRHVLRRPLGDHHQRVRRVPAAERPLAVLVHDRLHRLRYLLELRAGHLRAEPVDVRREELGDEALQTEEKRGEWCGAARECEAPCVRDASHRAPCGSRPSAPTCTARGRAPTPPSPSSL